MRHLILTEAQEKALAQRLNEETYKMPVPKKTGAPYTINPDKVLTVKNYLDKGFKKGSYEALVDGFPKKIRVVNHIASTGELLGEPFGEEMLLPLLIEKFKNMFTDHVERELFLKQVMNDWFDDKITIFGGLSTNRLM